MKNDINIKPFLNKNNKQVSFVLSKKECLFLKNDSNKIPKSIKIQIKGITW
jgi:hypothetical protein